MREDHERDFVRYLIFRVGAGVPGPGRAVVFCVAQRSHTGAYEKLAGYKPRPAWVQAALRWLHSLAWVMLAATCWLLESGQEQLATMSALMAGIMYVTFVAALVKDGQRRKALERESLHPPADRQPGG
jgi:hypothetical protein